MWAGLVQPFFRLVGINIQPNLIKVSGQSLIQLKSPMLKTKQFLNILKEMYLGFGLFCREVPGFRKKETKWSPKRR